MYKVEDLPLSDDILRQAESHCIPCDRVASARHEECSAGYGGTVFITHDDRERRSGCGHPGCTQCKWGSGGSGIGDEALFDFARLWWQKMVSGDQVPRYVRKYVKEYL